MPVSKQCPSESSRQVTKNFVGFRAVVLLPQQVARCVGFAQGKIAVFHSPVVRAVAHKPVAGSIYAYPWGIVIVIDALVADVVFCQNAVIWE